MASAPLRNPQTLGPSRAKNLSASRTFTHLRVWKATHKKLLQLAELRGISIAAMTAALVDNEWAAQRQKGKI